jgi:hypothetical protein
MGLCGVFRPGDVIRSATWRMASKAEAMANALVCGRYLDPFDFTLVAKYLFIGIFFGQTIFRQQAEPMFLPNRLLYLPKQDNWKLR